MSTILRISQYIGVHWSIFSKAECQRLVALSPKYEKLIEQQLSQMSMPAFAREFWSYGHGLETEETFSAEKMGIVATKYLDRVGTYSKINTAVSLPKFNIEREYLQKIYQKIASSFSICIIPFRNKSGEIRFWNYGIYAGPASRFCKENLLPSEYYLAESGNQEINDFILAIGGVKTAKIKNDPVIFNSHNRAVITNQAFKDFYDTYLDKNGGDLRSLPIASHGHFAEFPTMEISLKDVPATLLNNAWWDEQKTDVLLFEYFGGIFYFRRSDKKSILADIMKIKNNPYKSINNLVLRVPGENFQNLLGGKLFLGVSVE